MRLKDIVYFYLKNNQYPNQLSAKEALETLV